MKKQIIFEATAFEDFSYWTIQDKKIYKKLSHLLKIFRGVLFKV